MTELPALTIAAPDIEALSEIEGRIAILLPEEGQLDPMSRRINRLTKGAVARFAASDDFAKLKEGQCHTLAYPTGLKAKALDIVRLERRTRGNTARKAGAAIGARVGEGRVTLAAGSFRGMSDICLGALLRSYDFTDHRTGQDADKLPASFHVMTSKHEDLEDGITEIRALAEGVYFTRDLVNEPANVLTTAEFADRLMGLSKLGVKVQVLDEPELEELGMRTLLAVGQGSESPSKVVVMEWQGGSADQPPLALIGKGVVFDTGGISIKPAAGMEHMTMDMGGAGVVSGVMKSLALRNAPSNVVGLVGLVENMPDGRATRPGDVIRSMKGDTVEVINTDAEGRLVLADVLWYAAQRFAPSAMVDLATLTGAIVVSLGHHNAGLFSNDDDLAKALMSAASTESEGLWRMPLGPLYADQLKSRIADTKNSATHQGGAVTAAEFLQRFVKEGTPWAHIDIAGVTLGHAAKPLSPKGATGWGVLTLDRWIRSATEVEV